jgi:hypothetical protein
MTSPQTIVTQAPPNHSIQLSIHAQILPNPTTEAVNYHKINTFKVSPQKFTPEQHNNFSDPHYQ